MILCKIVYLLVDRIFFEKELFIFIFKTRMLPVQFSNYLIGASQGPY